MALPKLLLVVAALASSAAIADLEPAWTWKSDQSIDWCVPLGDPKHCAVAIGLADGSVQSINIITATPRLDEQPQGKPGIRFAGQSGGTAYIYDRYRVFAVSVTDTFDREEPRDRVRWTVGNDADAANLESGDPEFIDKIAAAAATPTGVAVLDSSGKIAEINGSDGSVRWKADLGSGANGALLVDNTTLCAVVKASAGFDACFFDLNAESPAPQRHPLGGSEPMWRDLSRDGLIAAWPGRLTRATPENEDVSRVRLKLKLPLKAALVALLHPVTAARPAKRDLLIAFDAAGELSAHDLATEATVWKTPTRDLGAFRPSRLTLIGDLAILNADDGRIAAYRTSDGGFAAAWTGPGCDRVLGVTASARFVHALRIATRVEGARRSKELQLVRTPIVRQGEWKKADAEAQQAVEWLGPAAGVRECVWSPGRVLIVSDKVVRMFVLPAE